MKVGLLGYGVVGRGVKEICDKHASLVIEKVLVKKGEADEPFMVEDIREVIKDSDVIVECIGGIDAAYEYIMEAFNNHKHVVSSNKKVMATFYREFVETAQAKGLKLCFEAAVGGGIPVMANIRHLKKVDEISAFRGIFNGTTNYILDKMTKKGLDFNEVLKEAQELGYAESDPGDDIDGLDVKYKVCLTGNVIYDTSFNLDDIVCFGIRNIKFKDIEYGLKNNKVIKLVGSGHKSKDGVNLRVIPMFVEQDDYFGKIGNNLNCISLTSNHLGTSSYIGQGAGSLPTAFSVVEDLLNPSDLKIDREIKFVNDYVGNFYIRTCCKERFNSYILNDVDEESFISIKLNIKDLRKIIKDEDFVAEIKV